MVWSKKNSRYSTRDQDKVITKQESCRLAAHNDGAEVGPVHLGLLGWKDLQTEKGFVRLRAQTCHHASQLLDTAAVATIPDHLVEARGAQAGMLLQHLAHKGQVWIEDGWPQRLGVLEAFHFNGAPYCLGVDV